MVVIKRKVQGKSDPVESRRESTLHDDLVERAGRWLRGTCGCSAVLTELRAFTESGESPDAVGWRSNYSVLVECKASRSDFLADKKKPFRQNPERGVGTFRFYLSPPGVIRPEDLPAGWGLLYADQRRVRRIIGPEGNIWTSGSNKEFFHPRNSDAEITLLASALRRCEGKQ